MKSKYQNIKKNYLISLKFEVPERYQSSFVHWGGGADVQYIYKKFLKDLPYKSKIMLVGVMGGRDYFLLKNLGYEVTAIDIGYQPEISPITLCNIEERLPFSENTFDAVLIGEVLEHLKQDAVALENIRCVLKSDGKLIVSIPFYNDWEDGHMRIHSPLTGKRLLGLSGFTVIDYLERPGFFWSKVFNLLHHGVNYLAYLIVGKTGYAWTTSLIGEFEWFWGHKEFLRPFRKFSRHFGGYYLCTKSKEAIDHIAINKELYTGGQMGNKIK